MNVQTSEQADSACTELSVSERGEAGDRIYERILAGIRFELELMNTRVNWLLTSQAFLFVPLAIGADGQSLAESSMYPQIPLLGLGLCLLLAVSILAAGLRLSQWRAKLRGTAYADERTLREFSGVLPRSVLLPAMATVGAFGVPLILIVTWAWLLVVPPT